jgi:hypothetical protein
MAEIGITARTGMVTMRMSYNGLVYGLPGINEEVTCFTEETFICEFDQQFALLLIISHSK